MALFKFGKSRAQLQEMSKEALIAELERVARAADEIDLRRQIQIQNQIGSINRLLKDGEYNREMEAIHEELARREHQLGLIRGIAEGERHGLEAVANFAEEILSILAPEEVSDGGADAGSDNA